MRTKKGAAHLFIVIIIIIIILSFVAYNTPNFLKNIGLSIYDTKSQLQQDYNTYWGGLLDSSFCSSYVSGCNSQALENDKFSWRGYVYTDNNNIYMKQQPIGSASLVTKQNFYGQEIVVFYSTHSAQLNGFEPDAQNTDVVVAFKPHTLDNSQVDIIYNGIVQKTIIVQNPFYLNFNTNGQDSYAFIHFIGYKVQFSCDLGSDEVWVHEDFAQPFGIKDLSFPPTKFCKDVRPFTLRDISQGETAITPDPIPSFNRGNILTPPTNDLIGVNYATPNVVGVTNKCVPDQANIKVAGRWICSQVIQTTTLTRTIQARQIIPTTSTNSFTFTTTKDKSNFNIGSQVFSTQQNFKCQFPNNVDVLAPPNPTSNCYSTSIVYGGKNVEIPDSSISNLDGNIRVQYFTEGQLNRKDTSIVNNLQGTYIFTLANTISIDVNGGLTTKQNNQLNIPITLTDYLPSNTIKVAVKQKVVSTNQNLPDKSYNLDIKSGTNTLTIPVDTSNLGLNQITITAYYPIIADAAVLLPSETIKVNIDIQSGTNDVPVQFVDKMPPKPVTSSNSFISLFKNIWSWILSLF